MVGEEHGELAIIAFALATDNIADAILAVTNRVALFETANCSRLRPGYG